MSDVRGFFENLVYHNVAQRRYTQQSPVMPDVWIEFGLRPGEALELLMVPDWQHTPTALARELKKGLAGSAQRKRSRLFRVDATTRAAVAHNQNSVVATLTLDQLVHTVLPMSSWWRQEVAGVRGPGDEDRLFAQLKHPDRLQNILSDLLAQGADDGEARGIGPDTVWLARVVGFLALIAKRNNRTVFDKLERDSEAYLKKLEALFANHDRIATTLIELLAGIEKVDGDGQSLLYSVNRNRRTSAALNDSVGTVKADATRRVFDVAGKGVRWAVIDSGIDATHIAFRNRDARGTPEQLPFANASIAGVRRRGKPRKRIGPRNHTRVIATYDFINIRELLSASHDEVDDLDRNKFPALRVKAKRDALRQVLRKMDEHMIDWEQLDPFLEVRHETGGGAQKYRPPVNRHGTHVAGIIAADWREADADMGLPGPPTAQGSDLVGISPQVQLYDFRVLNDQGEGNEFAIMSALQFVRHLNNRKDFVAIHGVNLSFSIDHDVANYACGRTPVCEEAERLVGSGTTVVAAAGNSGRARYLTPKGLPDDGFRTVSITDPGNSQSVITVGATHRRDPHTYGVSYFSSRGPTGDGRLKPDLVAPGEKILSTAPKNGIDRLDGTSMAAPHVSGAVALIMSRHPELMHEPKRLKEILCMSATDLGRERYFQGAGLLNIFRALESI